MLSPLEVEIVLLSLRVGFWAVLVGLPLAIAAAWLLARTSFPGKAVVDGLLHLPLVVPPVIVGYTLLVLLGRQGVIGAFLDNVFGISFAFNWKGAAVASGVMAFPLMVRAIRLSIEAIDRRIETAARTLGASPLRVFATITLPLALPGILSGTVLAFARSLGEFGATITFVSNIPGETRTLPLAVFSLMQVPGTEAAILRLVLISIAIALAALVVSEYLSRRVAARIRGTPP
ncbi:MAG: molybdate ABC transporter permease subunit [Proteobacteria bacterium]|nr:molybdate ABC transporter permease subunit [Pseudomonadota bacterium]MDA1058876.1 molybdate ABC transporter permease subunit [Pseudomonadota bacterium]